MDYFWDLNDIHAGIGKCPLLSGGAPYARPARGGFDRKSNFRA